MKRKKNTSKPRSAGKEPISAAPPAGEAVASERYLQDIATRGEAAEPTKEGKLPPGSTHAVVESNPDGSIKKVKRVRVYFTG